MTLLSMLGREQRNPSNPAVPLTSTTLLDWMTGPGAQSGVSVNEHSALGMPAVWRAVNLIAGTCAALPLKAYRDDAQGIPVIQRARLLDAPHPDLTPFEFWEIVYTHLLLWGNAYLYKVTDGVGNVVELWPIAPQRVRVGRTTDLGMKVYALDGRGLPADGRIDGSEALTDREILHIPGFGFDGLVGLSPITAHREGIGLALAAEQAGAKLFGSGMLPPGLLTTENRITAAEADELARRWKTKHGSVHNAHNIAVLGAGTKFQVMQMPAKDAQFLESRRFQISEIARMFGVPPHLLMDMERSTSWGTGIEAQNIGFITYSLQPWLSRVQQRTSKLLPRSSYAEYVLAGLLRGDTQSRYQSYATGIQNGWMSINEARGFENLAPVEGGDVHFRQLNLTPLGEIPEDEVVPEPGPPPPPVSEPDEEEEVDDA